MIEIKNLCKKFYQKTDSFHALKNINLTINKGELLVLKGLSGSGKSTLLSIIGGIMKPTSGSVFVDGENIVSLSDYHASHYRNTKVGFVTQSFHLFDALSVKDNIILPLIVTDYSNDEVEKKANKVMDICKIIHKQNQKVATLSGGEKQRTIIARALITQPQIILCDEPTANLDYENSMKFIEIIKELQKMGKTILIATHDPVFEKIKNIDRIIKIRDGSFE